jgi:hypothetical protein
MLGTLGFAERGRNMVRKNSDRRSMARWAGKSVDLWILRVREGEREDCETDGMPFRGPSVFRRGGV